MKRVLSGVTIAVLVCIAHSAAAQKITEAFTCEIQREDPFEFKLIAAKLESGKTGWVVLMPSGKVAPAALVNDMNDSRMLRVFPKPGMEQMTLITLVDDLSILASIKQIPKGGQRAFSATFKGQCKVLPRKGGT